MTWAPNLRLPNRGAAEIEALVLVSGGSLKQDTKSAAQCLVRKADDRNVSAISAAQPQTKTFDGFGISIDGWVRQTPLMDGISNNKTSL